MEKNKEKKFEVLFFLLILLWHLIFNFIIFPQQLFLKYPLNALKLFSKIKQSERFLDFSPFYIILNKAVLIFSEKGFIIIPYLQIFLCLISLYFLFKALYKISPKIAYFTIILTSLYPPYILYMNCLEPESLISFSLIMGISLFILNKSPYLVGIFFTLSFLLRPSFIPFALIFSIFLKKRFSYLLPVFSGVLFLLIFSYLTVGYPTLSYMSPGTVFYEGNNPNATGVAGIYPKAIKIWENSFKKKEADFAHELYRRVAEYETGRKLSLSEKNFFWFKKCLNYIFDYPLQWLLLYFKKIWFYLSSGEIHDIFSLIILNQKLGVFKIFSFSIFSSLLFLGIFYNLKKIPFFLYFSFFFNLFVFSLFYFSSRQRIAIFSFAVFLSFYGIKEIFEKKKRIITFFFLFLIFSFVPPEKKSFLNVFNEIKEAGMFREIANNFFEKKEFDKASLFISYSIGSAPYLSYFHSCAYLKFFGKTPYRQAISLSASNGYYNYGLLYFLDGDYKNSLKFFENIKKLKIQKHYYDQDLPAYYYIISLLMEGEVEKANSFLKKIKKKYPARLSLMAIENVLNEKEDLKKYYDILSINLKISEIYFFLKKYENSKAYASKVLEIAPEIYYAIEILAISNGNLGNFREMAENLGSIIKERNLIVFHREWQEIAKRLEERYGKNENFKEFLNYIRTLFPE